MRHTGVVLLFASAFLAAVRLCTGIVYEADEPVTALVLRAPSIAIERTETPSRPISNDIVVDADEPQLVYGSLYLTAMKAAPVVIAAMVAGGLALLGIARRRS